MIDTGLSQCTQNQAICLGYYEAADGEIEQEDGINSQGLSVSRKIVQ